MEWNEIGGIAEIPQVSIYLSICIHDTIDRLLVSVCRLVLCVWSVWTHDLIPPVFSVLFLSSFRAEFSKLCSCLVPFPLRYVGFWFLVSSSRCDDMHVFFGFGFIPLSSSFLFSFFVDHITSRSPYCAVLRAAQNEAYVLSCQGLGQTCLFVYC